MWSAEGDVSPGSLASAASPSSTLFLMYTSGDP